MRTLRSPRASRTSATRLQSNLVAGCGALHPTVSPHANSSFAARLANFRNQVAKQPGCRLRSPTPDDESVCELFVVERLQSRAEAADVRAVRSAQMSFHHVNTRRNVDQLLFVDDADRLNFLDKLEQTAARHSWLCHGFCLM